MSTIITGVSSSMPQVTAAWLHDAFRDSRDVTLSIDCFLTVLCSVPYQCMFVVQVSYVKAVDVYLWTSFLFVFLSVIEYAAVNYCTTLEEMRKMKRGKVSVDFNSSSQN